MMNGYDDADWDGDVRGPASRLDLVRASLSGFEWLGLLSSPHQLGAVTRIGAIFLWGALPFVVCGLGLWLQAIVFGDQAEMWAGLGQALSQLLTPSLRLSDLVTGLTDLWGDGGEVFTPLVSSWPLLVLLVLVKLVLFCAVLRAALFPDDRAFGFVRLGADEARVLFILAKILLVGLGLPLVGGALAYVAYVSFEALPNLKPYADLGLYLVLGALGLKCLVLYFRLSLAPPATVSEGRLSLMSAYGLSDGRGITLFLCVVLTHLVTVIVIGLGLLISLAVGLGALWLFAATRDSLPALVSLPLCGLLAGLVIFPVSGLVMAIAYTPYARLYEVLRD